MPAIYATPETRIDSCPEHREANEICWVEARSTWVCPCRMVEEFTVVTVWSRGGDYREFTRTTRVRATTVAEALDIATERLPASCDAILDQHTI